MGKRTRKTRWRTLEIGDSDSEESCSHQPQSTPRSYHPRPFYSKFHTFSSSQSTPTRRFNNGCDNNKSTRSSSTASDTKITFNEDEYTKITTPRQDVLFKKGYLNKPKTYQTQTSTGNSTSASTGNSTGNGTPDHQSADGTECTDVEYESQFVFPTFLDHNGIYYVNSFEPYPLMMYNPQLCYSEFPVSRTKRLSTGSLTESTSPNNEEVGTQSGGENGTVPELGHPMYMYQGYYYNNNNPSSSTVVVDVPTTEPRKIKKKRRRKASKTVHEDDLSSSEEDSSEEPTQIENKTINTEKIEDKEEQIIEKKIDTNLPKEKEELKIKQIEEKENEDKDAQKEDETIAQNQLLESVQKEEIIEIERKLEENVEKENIEEENIEESSKKETKFNLNAEEFVPRALRQNEATLNPNSNVQFVNVHPNFIPLPFVNHPLNEIGAQGFPPAFLPPGIPLGFVPHDPKLVPNFVNFVPNQFYAKPTFENVPHHQKPIVNHQKEEDVEEIESSERKEVEKVNEKIEKIEEDSKKMFKNEVDIAKIVSKLEEAAKEQRQNENNGGIKRGLKKGIKFQRKFYGDHYVKGGFERRRNFDRRRNEDGFKRFHQEGNGDGFQNKLQSVQGLKLEKGEEKNEIKTEIKNEIKIEIKTENDPIEDDKEKKHIFKNSPYSTPKRFNSNQQNHHQNKQNHSFDHHQRLHHHQPNFKKTYQEISSSSSSSPHQLNYSETVKKSFSQQQQKRSLQQLQNNSTPIKVKEETSSSSNTILKSPNQWIAVSNRKKRKNHRSSSNDEEIDSKENDFFPKIVDEEKIEENVDEKVVVVDEVLILTKEEEEMIYEDNKKLQNDEIEIVELILESNKDIVIKDVQEIEKEMLKEMVKEVSKIEESSKSIENEEIGKEIVKEVLKEIEVLEESKKEDDFSILKEEIMIKSIIMKEEVEKEQKKDVKKKMKKQPHQKVAVKRILVKDGDFSNEINKKDEITDLNEMDEEESINVPEISKNIEEITKNVEENSKIISEPLIKDEEILKTEEEESKSFSINSESIPEKKKSKKKKKIQKLNPISKSSSTTTLSGHQPFEESYDFLLDTSLLETDKTNIEVSEELDKMIQKGLFGNLEEKIKSLNVSIDEDFFRSLNFSSPKPQSTPDKSGFIKATDLSTILTNNNQFLQKAVDYTKIKPDHQASTSKDCAFLDVPEDNSTPLDLGKKESKNKGGKKLKNKSKKNRDDQDEKCNVKKAEIVETKCIEKVNFLDQSTIEDDDVTILLNGDDEIEKSEEMVDGVDEILEEILQRIEFKGEKDLENFDQQQEFLLQKEDNFEQQKQEEEKENDFDENQETFYQNPEQKEDSVQNQESQTTNVQESNFLNPQPNHSNYINLKPENQKICSKTYETFQIEDDTKKNFIERNEFAIENDLDDDDDEISSAQEATNETIVANLTETKNSQQQKSITQAVFEWMVKVREKTPEIEILKSPDTINREFSNHLNGEETNQFKRIDEEEEEDLEKNFEKNTNGEIEEGKDVLEICGKEEEFFKLEEEMEEIKRKRNTKHGDLPYRAICCSLM